MSLQCEWALEGAQELLNERNFYMVMVLAQGEISSYTVLCREAGQAKTLILKHFPGTEIDSWGGEGFFP